MTQQKIKEIYIKNYVYGDGEALLADANDIRKNDYLTRRATKKYMIENFYGYFTHDNMGPQEAKKYLKSLSREEIYKELEAMGAIFS